MLRMLLKLVNDDANAAAAAAATAADADDDADDADEHLKLVRLYFRSN